MTSESENVRRRTAYAEFRKKQLEQKELDAQLWAVKENLRAAKKEYGKTEDDLKLLQSVGQIIGKVLRPLDDKRMIVKVGSGSRYVVGRCSKMDKENLTSGTRVVLDMLTLTIMRALPHEVHPLVHNMLHEDPGNISYSAVGGLSDQIRELRESIELPLMNPELFIRVGIKPPKGVLLYGPPGTGKTLLARAIASNVDANFLKVKVIMATNRPDVLDPALLRPGRLDRKIEIPLPNELSRIEILKIHAAGIAKHGDIDYEAVVKLAEGFNGADLRNVCTEAGISAVRAERDYVIHEDFMKAVRKLNEAKKLESSVHCTADIGKE
ncbi:26S proteasome regulatory subunit 10B homolog A-like isoform X4 [Solanum pennellii]|uniref:26S proteasome regulatory subunit 10B homolog A-like isoform X4 n=1 Tax=Solanum pennellii TaxID=28526 RepID=A0ABM1UX59_SOLPN|nr:26S proteasome regulatory subunit 10B homolog A-like isoform X4 [Solanum pennellii]